MSIDKNKLDTAEAEKISPSAVNAATSGKNSRSQKSNPANKAGSANKSSNSTTSAPNKGGASVAASANKSASATASAANKASSSAGASASVAKGESESTANKAVADQNAVDSLDVSLEEDFDAPSVDSDLLDDDDLEIESIETVDEPTVNISADNQHADNNNSHGNNSHATANSSHANATAGSSHANATANNSHANTHATTSFSNSPAASTSTSASSSSSNSPAASASSTASKKRSGSRAKKPVVQASAGTEFEIEKEDEYSNDKITNNIVIETPIAASPISRRRNYNIYPAELETETPQTPSPTSRKKYSIDPATGESRKDSGLPKTPAAASAGQKFTSVRAEEAEAESEEEGEDETVQKLEIKIWQSIKKLFKKKPKREETRKDWIKALKKKRRKHSVDLENAERIVVDTKHGLTSEQVDSQIKKGYVNISATGSGKTYFGIILSNTFTFFNILAFSVAIAMLFTKPSFTQMFFIFIIFANIVIGIIQEIKAKLSVDKLHIITAPSALVIRDGQQKTVPLDEVVLDDIIHLETGKQIAADSIVLSGECEVNESMITGESVSVKKTKGDVLYSGSFLSSGSVYARVEKVGDANYAQSLTSNAKKYQKPKSELNDSIRLIMKIATIFIIPITLSMILIYLFQNKGTNTVTAIRGISGAVIGMIPAGMFLLTTVALASSVLRLASKKTLVKDLYCIEMLARVDTLCLDKTGTITDGSMSVKKVVKFKVDDSAAPFEAVIGSMLSATEDNNQTALALAAKFGYSLDYKPRSIVPFSSQRKYSMVSFDEIGTYILGAPEYVLKDMGVRLEKLINEHTSAGYRVIMLVHSQQAPEADKLPANRKPICMIVIEDQIRDDAIETIKWFKENDVAVKVISGDNPVTVSEIAKRVGIENAELYISLDGLSDQEIIEAASKYTVFGRVTPEQKRLLVRSMKVKGHTVAMTGDGVNDILAMREADCAIAIASGAEAARNVSHLVLLDNNFTAMPYIVLEGRKVVNNIQKSSALFLMKTIMSIFLALFYVIQWKPYPITTDNLLLLELFIIGVPSFFLALQPNQNRIQGRFLLNVIGRAFPGGLTLMLAVVSVNLFEHMVPNAITHDISMSMIVICLSFTGLIVLCKVCEPFNFYRAFFVILSAASVFIAVVLAGNQFGIADFNSDVDYFAITCLLFIFSEVLLSYFVITLITKLLKRANIIFD